MRGILKHALRLVAVLTALIVPARADVDPRNVEELTSASRAVLEGRVSEGVDRLTILLRRIDPAKDSTTYWRTGETLVSFLSQTENHAAARAVLDDLLSTKLPEANAPWVRFHLGRSLAHLGMADEGEKLLRALTGGDARLVHSPVQRAAAVMLSTIELDRNNVSQSAIWMRRAVIGTFVDKGVGSGEIIDVLTQYAAFLTKTRRLAEAHSLFAKLGPIYEAQFPHRSPAYLNFLSSFLDMLESAGNFKAADALHDVLNENASAVDAPATSIREQLFFLDLYKDARAPSEHKRVSIPNRLKQVVADYPDFLKQPRNRIVFSYLASLARDVELAEQFILSSQGGDPLDAKFAAYEVGLRSFIAARHGKFSESIALSREALEKVLLFHQRFENESSSRLPAFTVDERLVLGLIVSLNAAHVSSFDEADALFQLQQFLSRDKGKLGLNSKIARQRLASDLQREDARARDRLQELRDRLMREAVDGLLSRVFPIRAYAPAEKQDYVFLIRLEEIEDKISNADDELRRGAEDFLRRSADAPIGLPALQRLVKHNEALVMHLVAGPSLVTTCINSDSWTFHVRTFDQTELQQGIVDQKLLVAAVQGAHPPSAALDSNFPSESSYRTYRLLFGGIEACLRGKTHLLLAPDPDFFVLPWNALLTSPPPEGREFRFRDASWLPKSYALSLLPSVRSLYQLRADLPPSRAREMFLGIGAPDFKGTPAHSTQLSLASVFATRGAGNRTAIAQLPPLPSAAEELRTIAETLRTSASDLLLGGQATERELRKRPLNEYKVISFATHALVAGEIDGVTEPALALAPGPSDRDRNNDGLLTATEVANLALDANLVILSACNTAAPDGAVAGRGLSGLADAFFFAGARALAVTQWAVFSDAARQIGVGLVSQSSSYDPGVGESLRRTMVHYILSAQEDYLAHPRFWAAFVIAGDGAVSPLEPRGSVSLRRDVINVNWQQLSQDDRDTELISLARTAGRAFGLGITKPPPGLKRGGSYFVRIHARERVELIDYWPELGASSLVAIGKDVGVLGYLPSIDKSSAVFRLLNADHQQQWQYVQESDLWNFPVSIVKSAAGYILVSIENDFSPSSRPSTLVLTSVSEHGAALAQRRHPIGIGNPRAAPKNVVVINGHLVIAISGNAAAMPVAPWTNPQTGSKKFCTARAASELFSIDLAGLDVQFHRTIEDSLVTSVREDNGRLYAAVAFATNCGLEKNVRLAEVQPGFELRTVFERPNVNSVETSDFAITSDRFILVGVVRTFLPTLLTREAIGVQSLDLWDDSLFEKTEERTSAFILVLAKDGTVVGDRVFPDMRNRSLSNVVAEASGRFVAVGSALGDRGWVISFDLNGQPGWRQSLEAALRRFWGLLAGAIGR